MTELMWLNLGVALVNTLLAVVLAWVYWRNHREFKSAFTRGLLLFAAFFVLHNGMVGYHYVTMMPAFGAVNETWLLVEGLLQMGGMAALVYSTYQ